MVCCGLLVLNWLEMIYFLADVDSEGCVFEVGCDYCVLFIDCLDVCWWSLMLYVEDDFLFVGGFGVYLVLADDISDGEVGFVVLVL